MRPISLCVWVIAFLFICFAPTANAGAVPHWPYDRLFRESTLVVIAEAKSNQSSKDVFPDKNPWKAGMEGVVTVFRVELILKGTEPATEIRVLHFKHHPLNALLRIRNGPTFVSFATGPISLSWKDIKLQEKPKYLLFLKRMADGRYEAVTGQTDPAFSVQEIFFTIGRARVSEEFIDASTPHR